MGKSLSKKVITLYKDGKKLELLEYAYAGIFVAVTMVAGLIALINQSIGVAFLIIPLICLVSFCMNLVAWSIVKTTVEHFHPEVLKKKDEKPSKKKSQKATTTKKTTKKVTKKTNKK